MKVKHIILCLLTLFSFTTKAQWTSIFPGGTIYSMAISDSIIIADVGYFPYSEVHISTNNGISWLTANKGLPELKIVDYIYVFPGIPIFAFCGNNIFACFDSVYLSKDNGKNWAVLPTFSSSKPTSIAVNGNNIFIGTSNDGIYLSGDNGTNWTPTNKGLPPNAGVYALAINGNNIFASIGDSVYKSINNGASWLPANKGLPAGVIRFGVCGSNIFATDGGYKTYRSDNNGTSWSPANKGLPGLVMAFAISGNNVFVANFEKGIYQFNYNDTTWSLLNSQLPTNNPYNGFLFSLVARDNYIYAGSDNGIWQMQVPLSTTINTFSAKCYGDSGVLSASAGGGQTPYQYLWNNGITTSNVTALTGPYTVLVTDSKGNTATATASIITPTQITTTITAVSSSGSDGNATINVAGGTAGYSYTWSNGQTTSDIIGLSPGKYYVTVSDNHNCLKIDSVVVMSLPSVALIVISNSLCYNSCNGSIKVGVSGGTPPYSYAWSNGTTTDTNTGLCVSKYIVTVTDDLGNFVTSAMSITEPQIIIPTLVTSQQISCAGSSGNMQSHVTGGTQPYSYLWSNGAITADISGVTANSYSVTVIDGNGCSAIATNILTEPLALIANLANQNITCYGNSSGAIQTQTSAGTPPYSYLWNNNATTATISGLSAGNYSVTVGDANNCSKIITTFVTQPLQLTTNISIIHGISCYGMADGVLQTQTSGGTQPYNYLWSNGATTATISGLAAGNYVVTVTDNNQCSIVATTIITEPTAITANLIAQEATCFGENDGAVQTRISGGVGAFSYLWSNGATTSSISGLLAGNYKLTVTDANNCIVTATTVVSEPPILSANVSTTHVFCFGDSMGSTVLTVAGGTSPYQYHWQNGSAKSAQHNLSAGKYNVSISDAHSCSITTAINITAPAELKITIRATKSSNNNGTASVIVAGGIPPYSFSWSAAGNFHNNIDSINNLPAGTYYVTVLDSNHCVVKDSVVVEKTNSIAALNKSLAVFSLHPNPTKETSTLTYEFLQTQAASIVITDITGRALQTYTLPTSQKGQIILDATQYPQGLYFCTLIVQDRPQKIIKWIVAK